MIPLPFQELENCLVENVFNLIKDYIESRWDVKLVRLLFDLTNEFNYFNTLTVQV